MNGPVPGIPRYGVVLALLFMCGIAAGDDMIRTFSVRNEPVQQVLLALAEKTGISIVTDGTVTGPVSAVLHDLDPREAIVQLSRAADLLVEDRDGVFWISRVRVRSVGADRWILRATGAPLDTVIRALARETGRVIRIQADLGDPVDIETGPLPVAELLDLLCSSTDAVVHRHPESGHFSIAVPEAEPPHRDRPGLGGTQFGEVLLNRTSGDGQTGEIHLSARHTTTGAVLERLFEDRPDHFLPVATLNAPVSQLNIAAADVDTLWKRLVPVLDLHVVEDGDTWIVAPSGQEHRLAPFRARAVVPLRNRRASEVEEVLARIPRLEIQAGDYRRNLLVLRALPATLEEALALVNILENYPGGNTTVTVELTATEPEELLESLRLRFPEASFSAERRLGAIVITAPENRIPEIRETVISLDRPDTTTLYTTLFAAPSRLIAAAGASHGLDLLVEGDDGRSIYLRGTTQRVARTVELFSRLDRPREQLRFDLCIIQYQSTTSRHRGTQATFSREGSSVGIFETTWDAAARFDRLLSLQFDLLSALGYQAALAVSGELATSAARLVVDTSLRARDGDTVTLENTSTFRYRDYPEGDDSQSVLGVTREIDSGLEVELTGRFHRDRSVTVTVRVSLAKQGADLSGRGNPPPTSRKVVETTVRVSAGEPIVIGGLLQQEATAGSRRVPILGRIPLLGRILENESTTREDTEMVLYLSVFPERPEHVLVRRSRQADRLKEALAALEAPVAPDTRHTEAAREIPHGE